MPDDLLLLLQAAPWRLILPQPPAIRAVGTADLTRTAQLLRLEKAWSGRPVTWAMQEKLLHGSAEQVDGTAELADWQDCDEPMPPA